ncbi:hypothetical protein N7470_001864 [Penicillium chermesinum]|nr:hypothetical protein N7470_001864 [Penicillium chermesinum]
MPHLPIEVVEWIVSYLPENDLSRYAVISRDWKVVIERRTFRVLHMNPSRLLNVHKILGFTSASPNMRTRRAQIQEIQFKPVLPEYDVALCKEHETAEEQDKNNKAFSQAMRSFLNTLSTWPEHENSQTLFTIDFAQSASDLESLGYLSGSTTSNNMAHMIYRRHLFAGRYAHSYLQIQETPGSFFSRSSNFPSMLEH